MSGSPSYRPASPFADPAGDDSNARGVQSEGEPRPFGAFRLETERNVRAERSVPSEPRSVAGSVVSRLDHDEINRALRDNVVPGEEEEFTPSNPFDGNTTYEPAKHTSYMAFATAITSAFVYFYTTLAALLEVCRDMMTLPVYAGLMTREKLNVVKDQTIGLFDLVNRAQPSVLLDKQLYAYDQDLPLRYSGNNGFLKIRVDYGASDTSSSRLAKHVKDVFEVFSAIVSYKRVSGGLPVGVSHTPTTYQTDIDQTFVAQIGGVWDIKAAKRLAMMLPIQTDADAEEVYNRRFVMGQTGDNHQLLLFRALCYYMDITIGKYLNYRPIPVLRSALDHVCTGSSGWVEHTKNLAVEFINTINMEAAEANFWHACTASRPVFEYSGVNSKGDRFVTLFSMFSTESPVALRTFGNLRRNEFAGSTGWYEDRAMVASFILKYCAKNGLNQQLEDLLPLLHSLHWYHSTRTSFKLPVPKHTTDWYFRAVNHSAPSKPFATFSNAGSAMHLLTSVLTKEVLNATMSDCVDAISSTVLNTYQAKTVKTVLTEMFYYEPHVLNAMATGLFAKATGGIARFLTITDSGVSMLSRMTAFADKLQYSGTLIGRYLTGVVREGSLTDRLFYHPNAQTKVIGADTVSMDQTTSRVLAIMGCILPGEDAGVKLRSLPLQSGSKSIVEMDAGRDAATRLLTDDWSQLKLVLRSLSFEECALKPRYSLQPIDYYADRQAIDSWFGMYNRESDWAVDTGGRSASPILQAPTTGRAVKPTVPRRPVGYRNLEAATASHGIQAATTDREANDKANRRLESSTVSAPLDISSLEDFVTVDAGGNGDCGYRALAGCCQYHGATSVTVDSAKAKAVEMGLVSGVHQSLNVAQLVLTALTYASACAIAHNGTFTMYARPDDVNDGEGGEDGSVKSDHGGTLLSKPIYFQLRDKHWTYLVHRNTFMPDYDRIETYVTLPDDEPGGGDAGDSSANGSEASRPSTRSTSPQWRAGSVSGGYTAEFSDIHLDVGAHTEPLTLAEHSEARSRQAIDNVIELPVESGEILSCTPPSVVAAATTGEGAEKVVGAALALSDSGRISPRVAAKIIRKAYPDREIPRYLITEIIKDRRFQQLDKTAVKPLAGHCLACAVIAAADEVKYPAIKGCIVCTHAKPYDFDECLRIASDMHGWTGVDYDKFDGLFPSRNPPTATKSNARPQDVLKAARSRGGFECKLGHNSSVSVAATIYYIMINRAGQPRELVSSVGLWCCLSRLRSNVWAELIRGGMLTWCNCDWVSQSKIIHDRVRKSSMIGALQVNDRELAQTMYMNSLYGRGGVDVDWYEELGSRLARPEPILAYDGATWSAEFADGIISDTIRRTLSTCMEKLRPEPLDKFIDRAYNWLVSGSVAGFKSVLRDTAVRREVLAAYKLQPRPTKSSVMEAIPREEIKAILQTRPKVLSKAHLKLNETGGKSRAIYGVSLWHYIYSNWLMADFEKTLDTLEIDINLENRDMLKQIIDRSKMAKEGAIMSSYDYPNFNAMHTYEHMAMIYNHAMDLSRERSVEPEEDELTYWTAWSWLANSTYDQIVFHPKTGAPIRLGGTLFSGNRDTTLINTLLNIAYSTVVDKSLSASGYEPGVIMRKCHGDDIVSAFTDIDKALRWNDFATRANLRGQEGKLLVDKSYHEYLRIFGCSDGVLRGSLCRSIASFTNGNWESEPTTNDLERLDEVLTSCGTIVRRQGDRAGVESLLKHCLARIANRVNDVAVINADALMTIVHGRTDKGGLGYVELIAEPVDASLAGKEQQLPDESTLQTRSFNVEPARTLRYQEVRKATVQIWEHKLTKAKKRQKAAVARLKMEMEDSDPEVKRKRGAREVLRQLSMADKGLPSNVVDGAIRSLEAAMPESVTIHDYGGLRDTLRLGTLGTELPPAAKEVEDTIANIVDALKQLRTAEPVRPNLDVVKLENLETTLNAGNTDVRLVKRFKALKPVLPYLHVNGKEDKLAATMLMLRIDEVTARRVMAVSGSIRLPTDVWRDVPEVQALIAEIHVATRGLGTYDVGPPALHSHDIGLLANYLQY